MTAKTRFLAISDLQNLGMDTTEQKTAEGMLPKIIDGSPIPSFVINRQHKVIHWNTAIESLSGIKKQEIVGTSEQWRAFYAEKRPTMADLIVDGASADEVERYYRGCKESHLIEDAYEAEDFFPVLGKSGKWLHFTASPIKDKEGNLLGAVETLQDITEEKTAEEMLSKIIDGSSIPSFVISRQHKVTHWNTAIESLSGIGKQEVVGTDGQWRSFYTEKRPAMADLIVDGASADEIERYYRGKCKRSCLLAGAYEAEDFFPALGEGGKWLHFTASPIKDKTGEIIGAIETLEDITERKMAQEALCKSEKRFRDLFESALDAIWVHDLNGNIQIANKAAAELTGYSLERLCRTNVASFLTPAGLSFAREVESKLISHQSVDMPYQQRLSRRDGTELIIELTTRLITQNDQPVAFQNIARDVTRERKMRESMHFYLQKVLVAQEEERKRIARDLHDDTAQSLLLLIHKLDAEISQHKHKLSQPLQNKLSELNALAVEILNGIRRYAQELRPAILDDMGLVAALEWMGDNLMAEKGIEVDVQIDMPGGDLPRDTQLVLFRIAQEALANIKRHAEASKVVIRLEAKASKMRMIITDNGKGFDVLTVLADLSSRGKLGLVGMQERTQLLNGTMSIQSQPGKGTSVIIEVPLEK